MFTNKIYLPKNQINRQGAITYLFAILLPVIIAFIAFAVDYGVINNAKHELQNAADAGASAGIQLLMSDPEKADRAARDAVTANHLVGEFITFDVRRCVEYGTWDPERTPKFEPIPRTGYTPGSGDPDDVSGTTIPDGATAVRVTLVRSTDRNNAIPLFFAPVIGTKHAEITAIAIASATPGCSGFVGIDFVTLGNNMRTDAYNSDDGSYGGGNQSLDGDVCSNGPVSLASGAGVGGDAQGSSISGAGSNGATISGNQTTSPAGIVAPPVNFDDATPNNNNTIDSNSPRPYGDPYYRDGTNDLIVDQGRTMTLFQGTYYFRDMLLRGGGKLIIDGEVRIFIERELRFDNGTDANKAKLPINLQLFVGAGPVNLQGGHDLYATIYAPTANVTVANNGKIYGSIVGKTLTVQGGSQLHFDQSLADEQASGAEPALVY
ncbi:pilus assembly protein [Mariniblastus sp.]|nr:pilus assembly protein [Mariniblastus sp.]